MSTRHQATTISPPVNYPEARPERADLECEGNSGGVKSAARDAMQDDQEISPSVNYPFDNGNSEGVKSASKILSNETMCKRLETSRQ